MLPFLASAWSDFDQRHARTFLMPRADGHSLMDGNISARLPHRLLGDGATALHPIDAATSRLRLYLPCFFIQSQEMLDFNTMSPFSKGHVR